MNERVRVRADRLAEGITARAKSADVKRDGYAYDKFHNWLKTILRLEFENHELQVLGEAPCDEVKTALPVVLYFEKEEDRQEFIEVVKVAKPGFTAKAL